MLKSLRLACVVDDKEVTAGLCPRIGSELLHLQPPSKGCDSQRFRKWVAEMR